MDNSVSSTAPTASGRELSILMIQLLRGVLYRESDEDLWHQLLNLQPRVRDQAAVLGLELAVDEAEGYAFLRSRADDSEDGDKLPRLVARRPCPFR